MYVQTLGELSVSTDMRQDFNLPTAFWGLLGPQRDVSVNFTKTISKQTTIF